MPGTIHDFEYRLRRNLVHIKQLRSFRETRPEHRCFTFGLFFRGLVLNHIPVFLEDSVLDAENVGSNPIHGRTATAGIAREQLHSRLRPQSDRARTSMW